MATIDLSKAKIGDKFRTRSGCILEYVGETSFYMVDKYLLEVEGCVIFRFYKHGNYMAAGEHGLDLVEQVFDDKKDTTDLEIVEAMNQAIKEIPEKAAEREQELQRRQEVVELAEKLVTNELFAVTNHIHDMRELGAAINLDSPAEYAFLIAEEFVIAKDKYLKEGKL